MRDEDEEKDEILKQLGGEVDDFAGSKLKDPDAKEISAGGVTVTIAVSPSGAAKAEEEEVDPEKAANMEAGNGEHDPIAHILGMCSGDCPE